MIDQKTAESFENLFCSGYKQGYDNGREAGREEVYSTILKTLTDIQQLQGELKDMMKQLLNKQGKTK